MIVKESNFHYHILNDLHDNSLHYRIHYRKIVEVEPSDLYFLEALTWLALHKML